MPFTFRILIEMAFHPVAYVSAVALAMFLVLEFVNATPLLPAFAFGDIHKEAYNQRPGVS